MHSRQKRTAAFIAVAALAPLALVGSSAGASSSQVPKCMDETPTQVGTPGDDFIVGTPDDDVIVGLAGNDVIAGLAGEDMICGGEGNDEIDGGPDMDLLSGDAGGDRLDGAEDEMDLAVYIDAPTPVQASLTTGVATGDGTDALVNVEGLFGSAFDDTLEGDGLSNVFVGWHGNARRAWAGSTTSTVTTGMTPSTAAPVTTSSTTTSHPARWLSTLPQGSPQGTARTLWSASKTSTDRSSPTGSRETPAPTGCMATAVPMSYPVAAAPTRCSVTVATTFFSEVPRPIGSTAARDEIA
jgi:Ca2+-binding RTX toxin-like protein